ncbi:hypothetical protein B0O44_101308 [Pedobacter nutrimenti]|uniref:Uncharacterized protein n=2 Tax=Pedobacter nutrimenti TaxID=1241337 RepID=A0A318UL77_9SPHI|nr:hypothetical protein B0O44_101308 [Pedobacter nutrimenti]
MSMEKINIRNSILALIIIAAAATRFLNLGSFSSWSNFTPIGAMAMFGGAYFSDKLKAYAVPLITLLVSDVVVNYSYFHKLVLFYDGAFWVYLSFILMVFVGTYIKKVSLISVLAASVVTVLIHWLVSDIGAVLMTGSLYPKTFAGYLQALVAAVPFERNLLVSNLVYGLLMFGGFEYAKTKFPALNFSKTTLQHS